MYAARIWLFMDLNYHVSVQYFAWIILPICLVLFSAGLVHVIAPQAIGKLMNQYITMLKSIVIESTII